MRKKSGRRTKAIAVAHVIVQRASSSGAWYADEIGKEFIVTTGSNERLMNRFFLLEKPHLMLQKTDVAILGLRVIRVEHSWRLP